MLSILWVLDFALIYSNVSWYFLNSEHFLFFSFFNIFSLKRFFKKFVKKLYTFHAKLAAKNKDLSKLNSNLIQLMINAYNEQKFLAFGKHFEDILNPQFQVILRCISSILKSSRIPRISILLKEVKSFNLPKSKLLLLYLIR